MTQFFGPRLLRFALAVTEKLTPRAYPYLPLSKPWPHPWNILPYQVWPNSLWDRLLSATSSHTGSRRCSSDCTVHRAALSIIQPNGIGDWNSIGWACPQTLGNQPAALIPNPSGAYHFDSFVGHGRQLFGSLFTTVIPANSQDPGYRAPLSSAPSLALRYNAQTNSASFPKGNRFMLQIEFQRSRAHPRSKIAIPTICLSTFGDVEDHDSHLVR